MEYPDQIYVQIMDEDSDSFLVASEGVDDVDDGKVAVYKLVEVKTKSTKTELV